MNGLIQKTGLAVLGAALALPAAAQTSAWPPRSDPSQPAPTQPAPPRTTPPPATPPTTTAPATPPAAQAGVDAQTRARMESLHTRLVSDIHHAQLASTKATTPKLKALASKVAQDSTRLASELEGIARERGIQLTDQATIAKQIKPSVDRLAALQGPQFDDAYAEELARDREAEVAQLKAARDQTSDKDAKLKGWLDSAENVMEEHANLAYAARREARDTAQRQGRKPPTQ